MSDIYNSDESNRAKRYVEKRETRLWEKSQDPLETGVIPRPAYADMFMRTDQEKADYFEEKHGMIPSLSGMDIPADKFTHNNMQPFFGSRTRERYHDNSTLLENYTGENVLMPKKKEVESLFEPIAGLTNVYKMQSTADFMQSRIMSDISGKQNNVLPFQQVMVGPGLGMGYTAEPASRTHQLRQRDYVMPKTIDELRVIGKSRNEMPGRIAGPPKLDTWMRQELGEMTKEVVPKTWEQPNPTDLTGAMAAVQGATQYGAIDLVDWEKKLTSEYFGGAGPAGDHAPESRDTIYSDPRTQQLGALEMGIARLIGTAGDYGKSAIKVYDQSRNFYEAKTEIGNVTTTVKALMAPFLDIFRHTTKEYLIDSAREFGMLQSTAPSKPTIYDPVNYQPRTTIKETYVQDSHEGNITGPHQNGRPENPNAPGLTVRETLDLVDTVRNLAGHVYKVTEYDPSDILKTTHRETMDANPREEGNITAPEIGAYVYVEIEAPNTQRQFDSDHEYYGDPGRAENAAYRVVQATFIPALTQKQFLSDHKYFGIAGATSQFKEVSEEAARNFRNKVQPTISYTPGAQAPNQPLAAKDVLMKLSRQNVGQAARSKGNVDRVVTPVDAPLAPLYGTVRVNTVREREERNRRMDPCMMEQQLKHNPYALPSFSQPAACSR